MANKPLSQSWGTPLQPSRSQQMTQQFWSILISSQTPAELAEKSAVFKQRLSDITKCFSDVCFATSLAIEDMIVTDAISKAGGRMKLFTLATGRLH